MIEKEVKSVPEAILVEQTPDQNPEAAGGESGVPPLAPREQALIDIRKVMTDAADPKSGIKPQVRANMIVEILDRLPEEVRVDIETVKVRWGDGKEMTRIQRVMYEFTQKPRTK